MLSNKMALEPRQIDLSTVAFCTLSALKLFFFAKKKSLILDPKSTPLEIIFLIFGTNVGPLPTNDKSPPGISVTTRLIIGQG